MPNAEFHWRKYFRKSERNATECSDDRISVIFAIHIYRIDANQIHEYGHGLRIQFPEMQLRRRNLTHQIHSQVRRVLRLPIHQLPSTMVHDVRIPAYIFVDSCCCCQRWTDGSLQRSTSFRMPKQPRRDYLSVGCDVDQSPRKPHRSVEDRGALAPSRPVQVTRSLPTSPLR
jgi:hypothetical protein